MDFLETDQKFQKMDSKNKVVEDYCQQSFKKSFQKESFKNPLKSLLTIVLKMIVFEGSLRMFADSSQQVVLNKLLLTIVAWDIADNIHSKTIFSNSLLAIVLKMNVFKSSLRMLLKRLFEKIVWEDCLRRCFGHFLTMVVWDIISNTSKIIFSNLGIYVFWDESFQKFSTSYSLRWLLTMIVWNISDRVFLDNGCLRHSWQKSFKNSLLRIYS